MTHADQIAIARRYAKALFLLADKAGQLEAAEKDMAQLSALARENAEFRQFMRNPLLPRAAKAAALKEILEKAKASQLTRQFAERLALNSRPALIGDIAREFFRMLADKRGQLSVDITSAKPLEKKDAQVIANQLSKAYGKEVHMQLATDPALIGGLVIKVGDTRIDYSLASQFTRLRASLKSAPLPVYA